MQGVRDQQDAVELSQSTSLLEVNATKFKGKERDQTKAGPRQQVNNCRYCGSGHQAGSCPAYGKTCNTCGRRNHFSTVCRSQQTQQTSSDRNTIATNRVELRNIFKDEDRPFFCGCVDSTGENGGWRRPESVISLCWSE
jgi:hypothetical protein